MNDESPSSSDPTPDDEFRDLFAQFLAGNGEIDPAALAGVAGLPSDPAALRALLSQLQSALTNTSSVEATAKLSLDQAVAAAGRDDASVTDATRAAYDQAFDLADLWLSEVTDVSALQAPPMLLTRREWVRATMDVWRALSEPVASSISGAMGTMLESQTPEDMMSTLGSASAMVQSVGSTLFAMQLGHVVGELSAEVLSGGDIGVALLPDGRAGVLPQNVTALSAGLDVAAQEVQLYIAIRELAHARLFHHARWLPLDLQSALTAYAQGIHIDAGPLESLMENFDPSRPEELRNALTDGRLIPPRSDEQKRALERIETQLALIEGWVDVVTEDATRRLPRSNALAETMRRRRASGGPAESAFAALVGLELRPRRLREASAMWRAVTTAIGASARDALWSHPDAMPSSDDVSAPDSFVARLVAQSRGEAPDQDDIDRALEDLLRDQPNESTNDS
jgi:putative hydrolase